MNRYTVALLLLLLLCWGSLVFAQSQGRSVLVHLNGDTQGLAVERRVDGRWQVMCSSSCDQRLVANEWYRVKSDDFASRPFFLPWNQSGQALLDLVAYHRTPAHTVGMIVLPFGILAVVAGGFALLGGALSQACSTCAAGYADTTALNIGWTVVGTGSALIVAAALLIGWGSVTKVEVISSIRATDPERRPVVDVQSGALFPLLRVRF